MGVDVEAIVKAIRAISPECFIVIDGIQHAAHGDIDLARYDADAYVISPYKVFSRHGYGVAWISDRLAKLPHDSLINGPKENWELGTRDTGSKAIHHQEEKLTQAMLKGIDNVKGLVDIPGVQIIGGTDNPRREGLVAFWIDGVDSADIVSHLNGSGIRTHLRKADHYSGNILDPLQQSSCVRVSACHYNSVEEVKVDCPAIRANPERKALFPGIGSWLPVVPPIPRLNRYARFSPDKASQH